MLVNAASSRPDLLQKSPKAFAFSWSELLEVALRTGARKALDEMVISSSHDMS